MQYVLALLLVAMMLWQFATAVGLGVWWYRRMTRQENPKTYWFVLAIQAAILIAV